MFGRTRPRPETRTILAIELAVGMTLAQGNGDMGVKRGGERVTRVTRGHEGDTPVVYVTGENPRGCWPMLPDEVVRIHV